MAEAGAHARFLAAHRELLADGATQFTLPPVNRPPPTPSWIAALGRALEAIFAPIGRFFAWLGSFMPTAPYARIMLWVLFALIVAALARIVWTRVRIARRRPAAAAAPDVADAWVPGAAPARALLREADALAGTGRFAEAAHLLLQRSIEDISRHRPGTLRPALTSRDIAAAPALPAAARATFAAIAGVVERSLFGGRAVDADAWGECRRAYAEFALPRSWA